MATEVDRYLADYILILKIKVLWQNKENIIVHSEFMYAPSSEYQYTTVALTTDIHTKPLVLDLVTSIQLTT